MPIWLKFLEWTVQLLCLLYGHAAVWDKLKKATPLKEDPNPPLSQANNPNMKDRYGG